MKVNPTYWLFEEYREEELDELQEWEQVIQLDSEITNNELLSQYLGPVGPNEWPKLETYYSERFSEFVIKRIDEIVDTTPIELHQQEFDSFRKDIIQINKLLSMNVSDTAATIPQPAEQLLLKRLRQRGYDPSALEVSHIERGGPLYLLELFVTAARQQANAELQSDGGVANREASETTVNQVEASTQLVEVLIDETDSLGDLEEEQIKSILRYPVLMVSLWVNQRKGLNEWLDKGREGILEMATATGKTVAGIAAIAHLCGELPDHPQHDPQTSDANILVVAHSNAILSQWKRELSEKLGLPHGVLHGDAQPKDLHFSTGMVQFQTAHSLLPRYDPVLKSHYDLVIVDEVHHYSNEEGFGQAVKRPNYDAVLGLSATIGKDENDPLRKTIQNIVAPIVDTFDLEDAVKKEIIPNFEWKVHPTPLNPDEREEWRKSTQSITNKFNQIQSSMKTQRILEDISVPFTRLEDLGDFVQAYKALSYSERDPPDEWKELQNAIYSRTDIRHRSQPKIQSAIDIARDYLTERDNVKLVMFSMRIETTEQIQEALNPHTDHAYAVHSKVASSTQRKDQIINERIKKFSNAEHGVLIAPQLLDEGIDVPDAEIGINVAGTKTKLQLVQRMGRVLRKYGDQEPSFHHLVAIPEKDFVPGLDSKAYVQELNWVYELGELIRQEPQIEPADIDEELLKRAEERGHELWAQHLVEDWEVETVQGSVELEQVIDALTLEIATQLRNQIDYSGDQVAEADWKQALRTLRDDHSIGTLQKVWWLFPLYRDRPQHLQDRLSEVIATLKEQENL